ncbi:MAG: DUF1080 domain-containing protein [Chitinophagaceae bacterium]|jgi:hypothetical protein|nr:DUF1080 domain-containing protein [Chitinophagaceae bacterium]
MKRSLIVICSFSLLAFFSTTVNARPKHKHLTDVLQTEHNQLLGRWDITLNDNGRSLPSWLEVKHSGLRTLVGAFVSTGGSARPVAKVNFDDGKFNFSIPPQWENSNNDMTLEGTLIDENNIEGVITTCDGRKQPFKGVRAPYLTRTAEPVWGTPIKLFNGKDLTGWKATGNHNQWEVVNGVLTSAHPGSNLITEQKFNDFKLHIEFRCPEDGNSGVYLRGRYEVQIIDGKKGDHPASGLFSGVYGFLTPSEINTKGAGQWQSYDITLVGRMVTVVANGKTVICNQEIPGITGGALDSNEGEPGPIYLQGDHSSIEYRNIVLTPAK